MKMARRIVDVGTRLSHSNALAKSNLKFNRLTKQGDVNEFGLV